MFRATIKISQVFVRQMLTALILIEREPPSGILGVIIALIMYAICLPICLLFDLLPLLIVVFVFFFLYRACS